MDGPSLASLVLARYRHGSTDRNILVVIGFRLTVRQTQSHRFSPNHLHWTLPRDRRTFIVRVVEPSEYAPASQADIFAAVLNEMVSPGQSLLAGYGANQFALPEPFDLLVFPEAFAPATSLVAALRSVSLGGDFGCVHVGLRPSADKDQHLFQVSEIEQLIGEIEALPQVADDDLRKFKAWLREQQPTSMFNLGCLFALDVDRRVRVCIHPKVIAAQAEVGFLPQNNMTGANLLSLVTLCPSNKKYFSITIQPLICADALDLQTDRDAASPLEEIQREARIFDALPDHIDIVSLATCTPQKVARSPKGLSYREWHHDFLAAFDRAAQSGRMPRHHFATFVLSNFLNPPNGRKGGLSGLFEPIKPRTNAFHHAINLSCYGVPDKDAGNDRWSSPDDEAVSEWMGRAYIAALDPHAEPTDAAAKIFGFTLPSILRDCSPWKPRGAVTSCEVTVAQWVESRRLAFEKLEPRT